MLAAKSEATAFSDLAPAAYSELGRVTGEIEATLREAVRYARINYMMLMMVDPHVHFHVLPRYDGDREAAGLTIADSGWPKLPVLGDAVELNADQIVALADWLKSEWKRLPSEW